MSPKVNDLAAARIQRAPLSPLAAGVTPDDVDTKWLDGDRAPRRGQR